MNLPLAWRLAALGVIALVLAAFEALIVLVFYISYGLSEEPLTASDIVLSLAVLAAVPVGVAAGIGLACLRQFALAAATMLLAIPAALLIFMFAGLLLESHV